MIIDNMEILQNAERLKEIELFYGIKCNVQNLHNAIVFSKKNNLNFHTIYDSFLFWFPYTSHWDEKEITIWDKNKIFSFNKEYNHGIYEKTKYISKVETSYPKTDNVNGCIAISMVNPYFALHQMNNGKYNIPSEKDFFDNVNQIPHSYRKSEVFYTMLFKNDSYDIQIESNKQKVFEILSTNPTWRKYLIGYHNNDLILSEVHKKDLPKLNKYLTSLYLTIPLKVYKYNNYGGYSIMETIMGNRYIKGNINNIK